PPPAPVDDRWQVRRQVPVHQRQGQQPHCAYPSGHHEDGQDGHHPQRPGHPRSAPAEGAPYQVRVRYAEFIIPHPNDGKIFAMDDENSYTMYNAVDAETMEVAWQVIVDGNLDNTDMDYTGRFCASTCYNSEKALDLGGTM